MRGTLLVAFLFISFLGSAQRLISYEENINLAAFLINLQLSVFEEDITAKNGVKTYKMIYESVDAMGQPAIASGLIAVPDVTDLSYPLLIYNHGTTQRSSVPSQKVVGANAGSGFLESIAFASQGYVCITPDYIGLGESPGFHPYVHAQSYALDGHAMMEAVGEFLEMEGITITEEVFITGYSEGGYGSMAVHRYLELNDQPVTGAAHLSGPYSIGEVMVDAMLSDEPYPPGVLFLPYTVLGLQQAYGNLYDDISQIFKAPYVDAIQVFAETGLFGSSSAIIDSLESIEGSLTPKLMLQDSVIQRMEIFDPSDPLVFALLDNDLTGWTPQSPTRLFYCEADEQVPFRNAIVADSAFQVRGAPDVIARSLGETLDHGGCAVPALFNALQFFNSFTTTSAKDDFVRTDVTVFPNPAVEQVRIAFNRTPKNNYQVRITNIVGQTVHHSSHQAGVATVDIEVNDLAAGLYQITVVDQNMFSTTIAVE